MLGLTSTFTPGSLELWNPIENYFGFYGTDSIKLSRSLTLTGGLRWEPYLPMHDTNNVASHFDQAAFALGQYTTVFQNAPPGLTFPADKGFPEGGIFHTLGLLAPRAGLVWDLLGNAKTVVHVGYGILNDGRDDLEIFDRFAFEPPWGNNITLDDPTGGWANPFLDYPGGDPYPLPYPPTKSATFVPEAVYINDPLHPRPTYVQEWNVSIQQQLGPNWLLTANYIGNESSHIWALYQADPAVYIPGQCASGACSTIANTNSRRILAQLSPVTGAAFSSIDTVNDGATSSYNGMLLSLNRRLKSNLSLLFNYTWAHCINTADAFVEESGSIQNPYNLAGERGNCGSDTRQIYNMSLVAGTPHWTANLAERAAADWHLSLIVSGDAGYWFSPVTGVDASLTGVGDDRPDVTGNPNSISRSLRKWFNTADYSENVPGTYGNARRDSLLGPGGYEPDMAVYRDFVYEAFHKPQLFDVRIEAFNVINHPEFSNPTATFTSAQFGQILSTANDARIMQIAAKYVF